MSLNAMVETKVDVSIVYADKGNHNNIASNLKEL